MGDEGEYGPGTGCVASLLGLLAFFAGLFSAFVVFAGMPRDWNEPFLGQSLTFDDFVCWASVGLGFVSLVLVARKGQTQPLKAILIVLIIGICMGILLGTACANFKIG